MKFLSRLETQVLLTMTVTATAEVARMTRLLSHAVDHYAATVIQTAFRGYLARRELRALKGLVKMQALVRGYCIRKQVKLTVKHMLSLVRVQARVIDQRMRFSHQSSSRNSTFSDTCNSVWKSRYLQDISDRKSMIVEGCKHLSGLRGFREASMLDENIFSPAFSASSSFSNSPSRSLRKYDVFISFRGNDVRTGFISHLQDALRVKKINAYIDDRINKGDELWPALVKAIKDSVLFLVIFSENYACSTWCLRELSEILKSTKNKKCRVLPVFYKIDPSQVRYQTGSYQKAFLKHESKHWQEKEHVRKWRHNLTLAANLGGWDSRLFRDEAGLIREIVVGITKKLDSMFRSVYSDGVFGIGEQIIHIESLLHNDSEDVQFIGIWGKIGIGKTTVATQLFNSLCLEFESSCFLDNLREESVKNGILFLKKKLFSTLLEEENLHSIIISGSVMRRLRRKKALIVLDDLSDPQLLTNLVGVPNQFGKGSIVIITARDKQVFGKIVNNNHTYEVKALSSEDALQLFKFHAFDSNCYEMMEFEQLSQKMVDYANGIPSTLMALGSFLYGKSAEEWKRRLEKIIKIPCTEIQQILRLSYDGMDDEKKNILLDIASSLNDRRVELIKKWLDAFGYSRIEGMAKVLENIDPIDEDRD